MPQSKEPGLGVVTGVKDLEAVTCNGNPQSNTTPLTLPSLSDITETMPLTSMQSRIWL